MFLKNLFKYWTYQVFSPGTVLREKYEAFKSLLNYDKRAHELMADLEEIYHRQLRVDFTVIQNKYAEFSNCLSHIIDDLDRICPARYQDLKDYFKKFNFYIQFMLAPPAYRFSPPFIVSLSDVNADDLALVGGKALNLALVEKDLRLPIPKGFIITTNAFHYFIEFNNLNKLIEEKLSGLDINSSASLDNVSRELIEIMTNASLPPDIEVAILNAFKSWKRTANRETGIAMRSSAVGEDTYSSFAGQYLTVLNVTEDEILNAYKAVIISKYSPQALFYRINYGLSDIETPMAVLALEMIDSTASGVMYTQDLDNIDNKQLTIHSVWGLGEPLVSGAVSPDIFTVTKDREPRIVHRKTALKFKQMTFTKNNATDMIPVAEDKRAAVSLGDDTAVILARWGTKLEEFFEEPQDVEWCLDNMNQLFLLQSRPLKTHELQTVPGGCNFDHVSNPVLLSGGEKAVSGIGAGTVFRIERESDLDNLPAGAVLVAKNASPHYVKVMDKLSAVVTDAGSTAGHFSSVAREFGVPTLVNTGNATTILPTGKEVTVYSDGMAVYDGIVAEMLNSPCARRNLLADSPFARKLTYIMSFISPLRLVDPQAPIFKPEGCRSLHDILRFAHEKAVYEMFSMGDRRITRKKGARKLISKIPMLFYVLDVGDGLKQNLSNEQVVEEKDINSVPMKAVFKGLNHPGIRWSEFSHFDWAEYDKIVMSGGIISADSALLSSYAVISSNYLNLSLKFGYHFVILDCICSTETEKNHILFRFAGGGGDLHGKSMRAEFVGGILDRLGFKVEKKGDLVDAQLKAVDNNTIKKTLDQIGRLLGATRLMDMYLKDAPMVEEFVEAFMHGRYHFASVDD